MKKFIVIPAVLASVGLAACGSTVTKTATPASGPHYSQSVGCMYAADGSVEWCGKPGQTEQQAAALANKDAQALPTTPADTTPTTTPAPSSDPLTGPVGTSYSDTDAQNNKMSVTLTHVIDPAQGADSYTTPDNGKRFVGAKFTIAGVSGHYSDDANTDAVVIGSNGQTYTPDFDDIAGCTNFNDGSFAVSPSQSVKGCVTFQIPTNVRVKSVQWSDLLSSAPATWNL